MNGEDDFVKCFIYELLVCVLLFYSLMIEIVEIVLGVL